MLHDSQGVGNEQKSGRFVGRAGLSVSTLNLRKFVQNLVTTDPAMVNGRLPGRMTNARNALTSVFDEHSKHLLSRHWGCVMSRGLKNGVEEVSGYDQEGG